VRVVRIALVALAIVTLAAGCGGTPTGGGGNAGDALAYLPDDAASVVFVSTDVDGDQWDAFFDEALREEGDADEPQTLDEYAEEAAKEAGLDWEDDVKPLLGNDIAIAVEGDATAWFGGGGEFTILAALETRGGDVERVLEKARLEPAGEVSGARLYRGPDGDDIAIAVEDDVLLFATDQDALQDALGRRDAGNGLEEDAVEDAFSDLPAEALVRSFGSLDSFKERDELQRFASVPLVEALQSYALTVSFQQDEANVDVALRTDGRELDEADLPLVTGEDSPEVVLREREISGGNRNQSRTTVFLLRALRAAYPDSRFVRAADEIEDERGIDFEEEILRQFDGPSASYVSPDGQTFAARSEVRDPEALRKVLPRIAPHLPELIDGLQGLQSEGMALLFLVAPDAPAASPMEDVEVHEPATEDGLWRITGITGDGPDELHLGLVGDVFVVASSEERAREIAEADTSPAEGAVGAGILRADLRGLDGAGFVQDLLPVDGEELVASLEASGDELRARVRVELD